MTNFRLSIIGIAAGCSAALLATLAAGQDQKALEKAVAARQGLMKLIVWEAGPLFSMAKGDIPYDAATAEANAKDLNTLAQYGADALFLPGTSRDDLGESTAALPAIWQDNAKFVHNFDAMKEQTANVAAQAGQGEDALKGAVAELGKACGNCHETFRFKKQ
jgi:cytochrome c556